MAVTINTDQNWKFLYHNGLDKNGVDCTIERDSDHNLSIDVPHILKITLTNYNKKDGVFEGSYTLARSNLSDTVVFKKSPDFNHLIGSPEGFHGTYQWKLWAIKTDEKKCTIL